MIIKKHEKLNISFNTISKWGMYRQVKKEQIIDEQIKNIQSPSNKQLNSTISEWCKFKQINSKKNFEEWKIKNGYSEDEWIDFISRKWKWKEWCLNKFREKIPSYYLERKSMLDIVSYSLVRVSNKNLADELYLRIKESESTFEKIATKYSEGPEKNTNGRIGPAPLGNAHPLLAHLLQISEEGKVCSPRMVDSWWVILRKEKLLNTSLDDEITQKLSLELGVIFLNKSIDSVIKKYSSRKNDPEI